VFLKQITKFSYLFDFATNFERESAGGDAGRWRRKCLELFADHDVVHRHVLLIRDPVAILSSWTGKSGTVHNNNTHPDEIGITKLMEIYSEVLGASMSGSDTHEPVVIDSDDLAWDPRSTLEGLCDSLGLGYTESMLKWEPGPHDCDGPWAKWWYSDVWESDGWDLDNGIGHSRTQKYRTVPPSLVSCIRMSTPAYDFLSTLTASYRKRAIATPPSGRLYEDPRNENVLVFVGTPSATSRRGKGRIVPREMAAISPFDSSVQGGDATWEGIRVYHGRIFHLKEHLDRLFRSARALGFENTHSREEVKDAIFRVLAANGMRDGAHMRLTLTRGQKCTSSMNPLFNCYGTTLIILPEWKPTEGATTYDNTAGISLVTAGAARRSMPGVIDNKIHHNNMLQNILPKIQANNAGCADSLMLDDEGFVAETNATNLFLVRYTSMDGVDTDDRSSYVLVTPSADACLPGITRATVLVLADELGIKAEVRRVSLSEFYSADEVFTTGTMGELTPVVEIDGRPIGWTGSKRGAVTSLLQSAYKDAVANRLDWSTEIPAFS